MTRRAVVVATLLAVSYLLAGALSAPTLRSGNDTYRYAVTTLTQLGARPALAHDRAIAAYCAGVAGRAFRAAIVDPAPTRPATPEPVLREQCVQANPGSLAPSNPRYDAIFAPRIGYPTLAMPFVVILDVARGMWLAAAACTALAGILVFALLRSWKTPIWAAAAGQMLLYVSPVGEWGSWALAEGPAALAALAALTGAVWVVERRHPVASVTLLTAGVVGGVAVKYSTGQVVAAALCATAALTALLLPTARHRGTAALAAAAAATTIAVSAAAATLGWPGTDETLQDKFTAHFTRPDVADPWPQMLHQSAVFWNQWTETSLAQPVLLVALALACWGLWQSAPRAALLVAGVAGSGLVIQAAHPVTSQGARLLSPLWIAVSVGVPLAVVVARRVPSVADAVTLTRHRSGVLPRRRELHGWDERRPAVPPYGRRSAAAAAWPTAPISGGPATARRRRAVAAGAPGAPRSSGGLGRSAAGPAAAPRRASDTRRAEPGAAADTGTGAQPLRARPHRTGAAAHRR